MATFSFNLTGSTLSFTGGSLTLNTVRPGTITAAAAAGGGVQLTLDTTDVRNDFNGDGRSDILWRSTSDQLSNWLAQPNGSFVPNDVNAFANVPSSWQVVGTGDFNGDGRSDILWRSDLGEVSDWLGLSNGGFVLNDANAFQTVPTSWSVVGTGDFNGDGRSDALWRNSDGMLSNWLGQENGGFIPNDANAAVMVSLSWSVVGTGDFNGDGRDDVLWRNGSTGEISDWLATSNGGYVANDAAALRTAPTSWHVVDTGDYNGDGRDDVLWRSDAGELSNWLGQVNGGFALNDVNAFSSAPTDWIVQGSDNFFV
jgi:hypothetical protein